MKIIKTVAQLQDELKGASDIALVPTMGALHAGHVSLVERARNIAQTVVVSVFVNPTQFNDPNDLEKYPRNLDADAAMLDAARADILFAPSVQEMYPQDMEVKALSGQWEQVARVMEGALRPGHFQGVVQVVGRLFDIVKPQKALFGEKDFQQLAVICAMVRDERRPIEIVGCPIVRAQDGLALSSRNALLSADERAVAPIIYSVLCDLKAKIKSDLSQSIEKLSQDAIANMKNNRYLCPEYIEVVDELTLLPTASRDHFRICTAVRCGSTRLIDNI